MIVKERELVMVAPEGFRSWVGDLTISGMEKYGPLTNGGYFKVEHQLVCTKCERGVRAEDDHHCSEPD